MLGTGLNLLFFSPSNFWKTCRGKILLMGSWGGSNPIPINSFPWMLSPQLIRMPYCGVTVVMVMTYSEQKREELLPWKRARSPDIILRSNVLLFFFVIDNNNFCKRYREIIHNAIFCFYSLKGAKYSIKFWYSTSHTRDPHRTYVCMYVLFVFKMEIMILWYFLVFL